MNGDETKSLQKKKRDKKIPLQLSSKLDGVLRTLSESIEKLKISLILPNILENPITLRQYLGNTEYKHCIGLVEEYIRAKKKLAITTTKPSAPHVNYRLIQVIDYFFENFQILEYMPRWLNDLGKTEKSILQAFELLLKVTEERLRRSALSELDREKKLHELYHENKALEQKIITLNDDLKSQSILLQWKLLAKQAVMDKYKADLSFQKYNNSIKINQEIIKSNYCIRQIQITSAAHQKELQEELDNQEAKYTKMKNENLKNEKVAKDEKNKLLMQLTMLIEKCNQTISDKELENQRLADEYEHKKALFDEFMIEYNREEEEYIRAVKSKEDEEKQQQEEKILLFMLNRAARIIQKRWRRFMKVRRKLARKAAKKGKKGK